MSEEQHISVSRCFHAGDADNGQRLDEFLAERVGDLSRMRIANLIAAGECRVNDAIARAGQRLAIGDSIALTLEAGAATAMSPDAIPLEILFEDEHIVVLIKPAGMLVHPTLSVKRGTLANGLAYHLNKSRIEDGGWRIENVTSEPGHSSDPRSSILNFPVIRPGIVHRLDRATSGVMVVAKTQRALSTLSRHFHKRLVEKRYLALVHGNLRDDRGTISAPIGKDPDRRPQWWVMESGKPAETRFQVRERLNRATLVELEPVTGRTNQLRIHCAYSGHPIVGDELYESVVSGQRPVVSESMPGSEEQDSLENPTGHRPLATDHRPARLCLHAHSLAFHHPANGEWKEFISPLPVDFICRFDIVRSES